MRRNVDIGYEQRDATCGEAAWVMLKTFVLGTVIAFPLAWLGQRYFPVETHAQRDANEVWNRRALAATDYTEGSDLRRHGYHEWSRTMYERAQRDADEARRSLDAGHDAESSTGQ